jgi:hypothetical protein
MSKKIKMIVAFVGISVALFLFSGCLTRGYWVQQFYYPEGKGIRHNRIITVGIAGELGKPLTAPGKKNISLQVFNAEKKRLYFGVFEVEGKDFDIERVINNSNTVVIKVTRKEDGLVVKTLRCVRVANSEEFVLQSPAIQLKN